MQNGTTLEIRILLYNNRSYCTAGYTLKIVEGIKSLPMSNVSYIDGVISTVRATNSCTLFT